MNNNVPPQIPKLCFTTTCRGIADRLINSVGVSSSFDPSGAIAVAEDPAKTYQALWDTGASCSCISQKVVDDLQLPVISKQSISGATGKAVKNVHIVELFLPNNLRMTQTNVVCADIVDFDILIGMNIISIGDFVISNCDGKTVFSFRFPSMHSYDFTKCDYLTFKKYGEAIQRNQPCPCGSRKKYKQCCGRTS